MSGKTLSFILAGGKGTRLEPLTGVRSKRAKPAVPLFGRLRVIDIALRNMLYANIEKIFVISQYRPRSLEDRIDDWKKYLRSGQLKNLSPQKTEGEEDEDWYLGTADAIRKNLDRIKKFSSSRIAIFAGDQVYSMDLSNMLNAHDSKSQLTIATLEKEIIEKDFFIDEEGLKRYKFGVFNVDKHGRVQKFVEKPVNPTEYAFDDDRKYVRVSTGNYIFDRDLLSDFFEEGNDFGKEIIPRMIDRGLNIFIYPFKNYWEDIGTMASYFNANMELTKENPAFDIYDEEWVVSEDFRRLLAPPTRLNTGEAGKISAISEASTIRGDLERCVISPEVYIARGASLKECIVYNNSEIGEDSNLYRTIIDKNNHIPKGITISPDSPQGLQVIDGIVIVPKEHFTKDKTYYF